MPGLEEGNLSISSSYGTKLYTPVLASFAISSNLSNFKFVAFRGLGDCEIIRKVEEM